MAAGLDVQGSIETWEPAIWARDIVGRTALASTSRPADLVFSNPPCSRFSCMSYSTFADSAREDLKTFPQLLEAIRLTRETGARALWWETGPLAWSKGDSIAIAVAERLARSWGECHTLAVRADPRWLGIPQRRPRTHFIHSAMEPRVIRSRPKEPPGAGEYVEADRWDEAGVGYFPKRWGYGLKDPLEIVAASYFSAFKANRPRSVTLESRSAPSVLSGRACCWVEKRRWWKLEEYAKLMGLPQHEPAMLGDPSRALTLMSKGVSTKVAEHVARTAVIPTLIGEGEMPDPGRRLWRLDETFSDKRYGAVGA